ncbi:MAG: class I SAM-dependent methyltransferase [Stellaceae bacterium]
MSEADFIGANTRIGTPPLVPEIRLYLASEVTPLWQATENTLAINGLPPPYWAFAWPGGQALARHILDHPERVVDKCVFDLGAGSGLAAIAAARAGARRVVAAEIDRFAAAAIALNAAVNEVDIFVESRDILGTFDVAADLFLVGDMCYERPLAARMMAFLDAASARGADILLADPGRAYLPRDRLDPVESYLIPTSRDLEDRNSRDTTVYRLRA